MTVADDSALAVAHRPTDDEEAASIAANIETYLSNHIREGGHAYQHNMAARPAKWLPLEASGEDSSEVDRV